MMAAAEADRKTAAAAAAGDAKAFERLYLTHAPRIHALARWLADPAEAPDLVQDVFLLAWRKLGSYRGEAAFGTWLRRLAVNLIVAERRTRRSKETSRLLELSEAGHEDLSPGLELETRLTMQMALESLPSPLRDVVVLHDVEGFRHEEIGTLLGIPAGTSASRLHRARLLLRRMIRDD